MLSVHSRLSLAAALVLLASLMAVAPPGLCPCWLIRDVRDYHPHFDGHPERPHSHDYLFEMFPTGTTALAEPNLLPASSLIVLLALALLWHSRRDAALYGRIIVPAPLTPPPR